MESFSFCNGSLWDQVNVEDRQCVMWKFPPRSFFVERIDSQWHVLTVMNEMFLETTESPSRCFIDRGRKPESTVWRHYLLKDLCPLQAIPVLPDKPLVVRSDRPLTLLAGENALFFLHVPVFFRLIAVVKRKPIIFEEPISIMNRTWFGDPFTGDLCYSLYSRLFQTIDSVPISGFEAICPLFISNESETELAFTKICLHTEAAAVYLGARLWTNLISVVFKGSEQTTQIQIDRAAPPYEKGLARICEAREQIENRLMRRTFSMFKYHSEF